MTSRQILVTGGEGLIGAAVVRALGREGHAVVVDSLRPDIHGDGGAAAGARLADLGAELVVADVRDGEAWSMALAASDVVVHLAAKSVSVWTSTTWATTCRATTSARRSAATVCG